MFYAPFPNWDEVVISLPSYFPAKIIIMQNGRTMAEKASDEPSLPSKTKRKRIRYENYASDVVEDASYEDFICPICLQLLIEPVVMPCKHELCKICFTQNVQEANLQCPICRVRISSWARKQARNGTLICQQRWELIQKLFPEKCERRMRGIDDDGEDFCHRPFKRVLSENGEIRSEYEEEMRKIQMAREEECKASEEFIRQLMEEENKVHGEMEQLKEKDEEIARKIHQQINEMKVATPLKVVGNKQAGSSSKAKTKTKTSNSPTLERWFSPTIRLKNTSLVRKSDQDKNSSQKIPKTRSNNTGVAKELELKHKQEDEDFAFAMKLQQQFDKERRQEQQLERKKGSVDGYLLRKDSCTSTSS